MRSAITLFVALVVLLIMGKLENDSVSTCLQSDVPCIATDCSSRMIMKECLATRIPVGYFDHDRLACCFRCCLELHSTLYKISHDSKLIATYNHSQNLEVVPIARSSTLMSPDKIYAISELLVLRGNHAGDRTMWKILTTTTPSPLHWKPLFGGRHNVLTVFGDACFSADTFQYIRMMLTKKNDFGSLYYVALFSTQLFCPVSPPRPTPDFYNLLPVGIRSSVAMRRVEISAKTRLLDCSCAMTSINFSSVRDELTAAGIACDTSGNVLNIAGKVIEHDPNTVSQLRAYYTHLSQYKYVLSLSSEVSMTHCEYEAMHVGAIPILISPTNDLIAELYKSMPVLFTSAWSQLSTVMLENNYDTFQQQYQETSTHTKLHSPYWISQFIPYLITGKPFVRPFKFLGSLSTPIPFCATLDGRTVSRDDNYAETEIFPLKPLNVQPKLHATDRSLTVVVPRCCEDQLEFDWVQEVLRATSDKVHVAIYYKCPKCIPLSQSTTWRHLPIYDAFQQPVYLFNDSSLTAYGDRVQQHPAFDTLYNGKEVTAYLKHILQNYHQLSDQIMFLHSVPNAHLFQDLFLRTVRFFEYCGNNSMPVEYVQLNSKYKFGEWGRCCVNEGGNCLKSTWSYLFPKDASKQVTDKKYPVYVSNAGHYEVKTYSSSQFMVSKYVLLSRPYSFWERMMLALNGTVDLQGCPGHGDEWSAGHQLTGQYERLWHMIFYRPPTAPYRGKDMTLPKYLRIDCYGGKCADGVV